MHKILAVLVLFDFCFSMPLQAASLTVQVVNDKQKPLPDAVVYLGSDQTGVPAAYADYEIEQKNKMFNPFVTVVPTGAKIMFPNRDGIGHQIYSFSPAKNFQLPLSEQESTGTISFDQPGLVTLGCNIHDWMAAYIYVVDTPWYAKTSAQGVAVIDNLPAGDYTIQVAHPGMKSATSPTRPISLTADTDAKEEFTLELKPEFFWRPTPRADEETY